MVMSAFNALFSLRTMRLFSERRFYIALIFIKVDGADAVNAVGAVGAVNGAEAADEHPQLVTLLPSKSSCFTRNSRPHLHLQSQ